MIGQILPFQQSTMKDGLVSNGVSALLQDSRGFMWIGTGDGVSVYDGYEFTNYTELGGHSLGLVTAFAESKTSPGMLWFSASGTSLSTFIHDHVVPAPNPLLQPGVIVALVEDEGGTLWCATEKGLYVVGTVGSSSATRLLDGFIPDVVESRDGLIWVATGNVVNIFSQQRELRATIVLKAYHANEADQLLASIDGSVWVATDRGTILQFSDTTLVSNRAYDGDRIREMCEDSDGYLWLCTEAGQLIKLPKGKSNDKTQLLTTRNGIGGKVLTTLVDREDNLWLGLLGQGLQKLTHRNVAMFPIEPLPLGYTYQPPLCCDSSGRFWAIGIDGLLELLRNDVGQWTLVEHSLHDLGLRSRPGSVQFGPKGTMWVGTLDGGINELAVDRPEFRRSNVQRMREFRPALNSRVGRLNVFVVDRGGNVWCNLLDSAVVVFDNRFKHIRTLKEADGLPSTNISAMFLDRDNVMWFGGNGVAMIPVGEIRTGRPRTLKSADGLPDEAIRSIFQDAQGRMIFGTRYGGLAIYENGIFKSLTTSEGLSNNCVWSISADSPDHMWVCTQAGLQRVDMRTLHPEVPINALRSDRTICCSANRGTVVGWRYGSLVVYEGNKPAMSSIPPPIHITRLEVNVRPVQINNPLTFSHDLDTWTFKFVGISFREDSDLRYQYRLLDHNPEWSPPDAQRTVTLAELPPDTYRFEVRAIDSKGLQSLQPASLVFTILPPFWKTWWAYLSYGVFMLAAVVLWRRHEIRKIRRKEREEAMLREVQLKAEMAEVRARAAETKQELEKQQTRMQIARDLHDEVGSTLSSITLFAQAIRKGDKTNEGNSGKLLSLISESSSYAKEAISDIIWAIDPGNDSWENLSAKLRRYASDLLESKKIVHTIEMDVPSQPCLIDPQRRRHLWLLFKEIITNVVKHSSCTEAHVRLSIDESHITLTVEDNGVGFDSTAVHEGNGLRNIRSRGEILGASVGLASNPGAGTRWTIGLRL